ncbi:MAG: amidohydrolase family protein [Kiritimatiellae bacterium]|nr:amidohydrolase family protein [Kiritimatiellia bacterium]
MKIIDTHTHFPGHTFGCMPKTGAQLRREFKAEGIDAAWIMTTDGLLKDPVRHNDLLANGVKNHCDFFISFCTVSPHDNLTDTFRELERCACQLKMRGLKLHPWLQAFSMTHPNVVPILRKAGELEMPVLFHDDTPPYSAPLQIAYAAEQVPQTTIILGHSGLDDLWEEAVIACQRHPNIYLCLQGLSAGYIREIIKICPVEKLLFGSDGGFIPDLTRSAIAKIRCAGAPDTVLRQIFLDNPRRLLPLEQLPLRTRRTREI